MFSDFQHFNTGTLFLIRTPEVFPQGYAETCFQDMKALKLDYAAWLETWNCQDGVLWKSKKFPRSPYWQDGDRDPIEETFLAADRHDMAFIPEAGVMHSAFRDQHKDAMVTDYDGKILGGYGRLGLVPSCSLQLDYFIAKYDDLMSHFQGHPSLKALTLPCENMVALSYDRYTRERYRQTFGQDLPSPQELSEFPKLERQVFAFLENEFLRNYTTLSTYLKQTYGLPLMHYPLGLLSANNHFQPLDYSRGKNLELMVSLPELDMVNMQIHPPLNDNPYFFKAETEIIAALAQDKCYVADTHFYHEGGGGMLPNATPKRFVDWLLSTITPYGISFFCYGFFAPELPAWKKELNPGAPVYRAYADPEIHQSRRRHVVQALAMIENLRPHLEHSQQLRPVAIFFKESFLAQTPGASYVKEHLIGTYEAFQAASLPTGFTAEIPTTTQEIKLLVLAATKQFTEQDATRLHTFMEHGGAVLIFGKCNSRLLDTLKLDVRSTKGTYVRHTNLQQRDYCFAAPPEDSIKTTVKNYDQSLLDYENGDSALAKLSRFGGTVFYLGAGAILSDFANQRLVQFADVLKLIYRQINGELDAEMNVIHCRVLGRHRYVSTDFYRKKDGSEKLLLIRNFGLEAAAGKLNINKDPDFQPAKLFVDMHEIPMSMTATTTQDIIDTPLFEHMIAVVFTRKKQALPDTESEWGNSLKG